MHSDLVASRSADPKDSRESKNGGGPQLDAVSLAIIEQLQEDGRRPYAAIGKAVGLSEAAVRQRVQKLLDQGVMQIVAVTDPLTVGFRRQAMVGVNVEGDVEAVADALAAMAECEYVVMTAGSFDLMVEIVCEDDDHLLEVINKRIRAVPGCARPRVSSTSSSRSRPTCGEPDNREHRHPQGPQQVRVRPPVDALHPHVVVRERARPHHRPR